MRRLILLWFIAIWLTACGVGEEVEEPEGFVYPENGAAAALTTQEFNGLPKEKQYYVANKLYGTVYKGVPAKTFFDFSEGSETLVRKADSHPLAEFRNAISRPMYDHNAKLAEIEAKYFTDPNSGGARWDPLEVPLTYLHEMDLSADYFNYWIAYQLTNNILFSPALELDSVDRTDVQTVYTRLVYWIAQDRSIRDIIYDHMISEENWRRFRSPEDNTREMMEIYLLRFIDEEVPKAATACKNWYLTDDSENYQLLKTTDFNTEAQSLLETNNIVNCEDFFRAVADHPQLIPGVTRRIVEALLSDAPQKSKDALVGAIVQSKPTTFRQLYAVLINSKTFLLHAPKTKSVEEVFFSLASRLDWKADRNFFSNLTNDYTGNANPTLRKMNQLAMTYKLGRSTEVPVDTLSFAYFHNLVRSDLLLRERSNGVTTASGWNGNFYIDDEVVGLSNEEFIDYVFVAILGRKASAEERTALLALYGEVGAQVSRQHQTHLLFDYMSRLSELYAYNS